MAETTTERLYRELKRQIITCRLAPGVSLSEKEICDEFQASRTPVREVCRRLENEHLMVIVPYRGYTVAPVNMRDFHSLHEMQLILDPAAAALAATRATPEQLERIQQLGGIAYHHGSNDSYYSFLQRNFDFHQSIAEASQNEHLLEATISIQTRLMRFFYLIITMDAFGSELMDEHAQLVSALLRRDMEAAREAAVNHVRQTNRRGAAVFAKPANFLVGPLAELQLQPV